MNWAYIVLDSWSYLYVATMNPLKFSGILWNPLESSRILWNPLESFGILWNSLGTFLQFEVRSDAKNEFVFCVRPQKSHKHWNRGPCMTMWLVLLASLLPGHLSALSLVEPEYRPWEASQPSSIIDASPTKSRVIQTMTVMVSDTCKAWVIIYRGSHPIWQDG
jgi:hypothetical protein